MAYKVMVKLTGKLRPHRSKTFPDSYRTREAAQAAVDSLPVANFSRYVEKIQPRRQKVMS